ncbi:hypothetical protein [Azospirillum sp. SYSU D00513]|uniref:hypothetical protein n=1 Tax=Azospirillum sp. SYSU D00513 TaxID=2812561 RepID=UPI001A978E3E|nr:hypothetical protein [Azospirillum sp. SYSU D00513]
MASGKEDEAPPPPALPALPAAADLAGLPAEELELRLQEIRELILLDIEATAGHHLRLLFWEQHALRREKARRMRSGATGHPPQAR